MKNLISIYVSLFLVLSPLYGQTKHEATLYTTNGEVTKVTIISVSKDFIKIEMINRDGKIIHPNVPKSMIYKLLSPDGKLLYPNLDAEDELKLMAEENRRIMQKKEDERKQLEEENRPIIQKKEDERKQLEEKAQFSIVSWHITTSNGDRFEVSGVQLINEDSLLIVSIGSEKYISIGLIEEIVIKKNSHIIKTSLLFGLAGLAISEVWGVTLLFTGNQPLECDVCSLLFPPILIVPPALVLGALYGVWAGRDDVYRFTGNSEAEKIKIIQKILND